MIYWGYHSDLTGERTGTWPARRWSPRAGLAACVLIGVGHPVITMIALCIALMGQQSLVPDLLVAPQRHADRRSPAGGLAMINAVGNFGGWLGPSVYGLVKDATGSADIGLLLPGVGAADHRDRGAVWPAMINDWNA